MSLPRAVWEQTLAAAASSRSTVPPLSPPPAAVAGQSPRGSAAAGPFFLLRQGPAGAGRWPRLEPERLRTLGAALLAGEAAHGGAGASGRAELACRRSAGGDGSRSRGSGAFCARWCLVTASISRARWVAASGGARRRARVARGGAASWRCGRMWLAEPQRARRAGADGGDGRMAGLGARGRSSAGERGERWLLHDAAARSGAQRVDGALPSPPHGSAVLVRGGARGAPGRPDLAYRRRAGWEDSGRRGSGRGDRGWFVTAGGAGAEGLRPWFGCDLQDPFWSLQARRRWRLDGGPAQR